MKKHELDSFITFVCTSYGEQWATYNQGALESVIESHAKNNGYQLGHEPYNAIVRMCRKELLEVYNIK